MQNTFLHALASFKHTHSLLPVHTLGHLWTAVSLVHVLYRNGADFVTFGLK